MFQHCCYLLHTHTHKGYFRHIILLSSKFFGMTSLTVFISQGTKFSQKHSHCTTHHSGVSHFLKMFCHQLEAFSQHSTTQDCYCSSNFAFCSSLISGCVQHRTFIHLLHYLCPLPQILRYDRQANQNLMQVLIIIYKPEKECVLHPGFP
jgi:hypothetical protein